MPQDKLEDMLIAMTQRQRTQLFGPRPSPSAANLLVNVRSRWWPTILVDSKMLRAIESTGSWPKSWTISGSTTSTSSTTRAPTGS
jgi:hypothetical protein